MHITPSLSSNNQNFATKPKRLEEGRLRTKELLYLMIITWSVSFREITFIIFKLCRIL